MIQDFRFALRQLFKYPGFSLAVILTLTLGIGVNTAVFSMVNGFLLRALPYPQPERIAALVIHHEGTRPGSSKPTLNDDDSFTGDWWQLLKDNVKGVTFAARGGSNGVNLQAGLAAGGAVRYAYNSRVSAHYFDVLGVSLYRGRSFTETEDRPHGPPVVVLSYPLWTSTFGSDPQIIGKAIQLKGEPYTVVGVLPPNAQIPSKADLYTPLQPAPTGECGGNNCGILVRLQPGWTWQQVNAQLSHIRLPGFSELEPKYHGRAWFYARPLQLELAAMREIPGVQDAAVGLSVPYEVGLNNSLTISDGPQAGKGDGSSLAYVTPGYFSTLRIPLLAGRVFTDGDTATSQPVAVVNTAFGKHFCGDPVPIGRQFNSHFTYTIVGVIADVAKQPGMEQGAPIATEPVFYLPVTQTPQDIVNIAHIWFQPSWIVRTNGPIRGLTAEMQRALANADPNLPISGFYSMDQILAEQLQKQRVEVLLLVTLAGLALLLSAIGIYALVSNLVVQRTREIGIRMALGSTIQQAMLQVGSSGMIAAVAGLISGIALSFFALRVLSSEIYGIHTYDPVTLIAVPLLLALIAVGASFLPTLRISRIQPADTLRSE